MADLWLGYVIAPSVAPVAGRALQADVPPGMRVELVWQKFKQHSLAVQPASWSLHDVVLFDLAKPAGHVR